MSTNVSEVQLSSGSFIDVVKQRRSVRVFDPSWTIGEEELRDILQTATLAPSSSNMQPWRFLVIQDAELKQKLLPIAYNQQQVVDASAVIVVLGDTKSYEKAETIYDAAVAAGYMTEAVKEDFVKRSVGLYSSLPSEVMKGIVQTDGGLVAMQLMLAAKAKGYDTVPMGGYDAARLIEAFGIPSSYVPIMLIALGKAAKEGHPTTRLPLEEVVFWDSIS
ncbi:nitroreductase family protein [Paenibacillus ginsengarvi]|uniref:Nitroreductase family protein n=1 Tax=Paenibacillus ginsengarvi TaxID=400777 RepID=A0A3B0CG34_9BACL|nr:nitroreductase family protein [Paenibacillus ginsengarvi]RKN84170.1 nitroreductase family protein [Paenibacillus ginsengarvi]